MIEIYATDVRRYRAERRIMKKERLMTVLETAGAFVLALLFFMNTAELRKCIIWGIVLIVWLAVFEIPKRVRNKKKEK